MRIHYYYPIQPMSPHHHEEQPSRAGWRISDLVIALVILALLALAAFATTPQDGLPLLPVEGDRQLSTNPELIIVRSHAATAAPLPAREARGAVPATDPRTEGCSPGAQAEYTVDGRPLPPPPLKP